MSPLLKMASLLLVPTLLAGCNEAPAEQEAHGAAEAEFERGPHRGRMLRDGNFVVEVTIFEDGVEPEFHLYAYRDDKPVRPQDVQIAVELTRLGGRVDRFAFTPQDDYLRGGGVVREPHSFDVKVRATEVGRTHNWAYASYEGRTNITADAARAGGVRSERAGPATIAELIDMSGRIEITPEGKADVRARLPGVILSMQGELGQQVRRGQVLLRVESSHSLQTYIVTAPISGTIVEKNANIGDVTGDRALFVIADPTQLHAEFFVYPRDAERVKVGQAVSLRSLSGEAKLTGTVEAILPTADLASQTVLAHVHLPPSAANQFRPGMGIEGAFSITQTQVPLAVRTKAIQRFRDFDVVYARVGNSYEVRMLELGRRTPEWTQVLGGLEPGTDYVTDGAFLIRADIDKAGASHDH
ncbi:efflux RND transporter periplasmic adaptor subunit [Sphingobium sp. KCTC 72723]|uniref:efflux RND transporter periplasmic adaptor subunit n=1 Tax=Sphingobium sp. KCTC 72723 TaxID=2733867 RepID=UPI00165E50AE|nr:HlyD family efflux transporter periplasmic adaptor subunit [Sphingobium sp. KCTC 72723]